MRERERGAALLLVLWLIVLLTGLIGSFALSARIEMMQGRGLARGVVAAQIARAGVEVAISRLQAPDPAQRWLADGHPYVWEWGTSSVTLRIVDEAGKVDLNASDAALLSALIRQADVPAERADALAAAIVDWRDQDDLTQPQGAERAQYLAAGLPYGPKNALFETVSELQWVLGMDTDLYARLWPDLTVHTGWPRPHSGLATPAVLAALGVDVRVALSLRQRPLRFDQMALLESGSRTYAIESLARLADGRESRLYAVIRVGAAGVGMAYTILEWKEGVLLQ